MHVVEQTFVSTWPPLEAGGMRLSAEAHAYTTESKRRNVYFTRPQDRRQVERHPRGSEVTRLTYMAYEDQQRALFLGMSVGTAMRRAGMGRHLLDYFIENVGRVEGLEFVGTGKLHKPVIALIAARVGLTPRSMDCIAEIMPSELAAEPEVPIVRFLNRALPASEMKSHSTHTTFYETAAPGAYEQIPVDPSMVVALHTGYMRV